MTFRRVAIVFDNTARPETTGLYCRRALGRLVEVEHLLPGDLEHVDPGRFDAFVVIDDGLDYPIPDSLHPRAWWAIDTHLSYERCRALAQGSDLVFAAQRDGTQRLQHDGIRAGWLPLACDPELHGRQEGPKIWDWSFIGHSFPGPRADLLALLQQHFPNHFVGQRYFEEMAQTYSASRLVFNRSVANDLNMRVFEALASGSLLVMNDLADNGQEELLHAGEHCVTYRDAAELIERCDFYLRHDGEREQIAAAGRARVLERHTYRHRMAHVLERLEQAASAARVAVPTLPQKDTTYFEWDRPDVLALIPPSARRILDLGCGGGRLGAALKQRQACEVWGIERDPTAAARAATRLDRVLCGDLEADDWSVPRGAFDAIVCADILEHLRAPEAVLRRCREWLAPGGCLVASLPNVQHHSFVTGLLDGNLTYEPSGLLDADHLRLYTRREIEKLLFRTGFHATSWNVIPGDGFDDWVEAGQPGAVRIGPLQISGLTPAAAEAFYVYQYLVVAQPQPLPPDRLTSVILVTHNQLDYTRRCVESVRFRTDEPLQWIVVDNASTDGTVEYFRAQPDVQLITNPENRGFPAAVNQGLAVATGEQILLLNNDTIVTTGWLRRMLDALVRDPQIGLVGPVSNSVSGPQQIDVAYRDLAGLDGFAWEWGQVHAGQVHDLDRLVGFCLLIRKTVVDRIGGLDERFGIGNFEDDDYCRRARQAGFRTVVAADSFVHHFGHRTFQATGVDFQKLLVENERKYREKWDGSASPVSPRSAFAVTLAPGGGLLLQPRRPRLSLCMIVRDNETTIRPCLESIRPWVDEMIVIDTGSTDRTPEICRELGATVQHWAWRDDFAAARNESLNYATGEWIFWMDSDDTIPTECGRKLRTLAEADHPPEVLGFVMQVHCPGPGDDGQQNVTIVDHVKLFRHRPDLRFEHRIHEQILPAIRRAGGEVAFTDAYVVHSGSDHSPEGRIRKLERDFKLLGLDLEERPDHPFVLFNLGMTHADCQHHAEAAHWLRKCLDVSRSEESHVRKAYALLVSVLYQQQRFDEAFAVCQRARTLFADDKELLFRQAMLQHRLGLLEDAVHSYRTVLEAPTERYFASVDAGLASYKARHNLALVYEDLRQTDLAKQEWQAILETQPGYPPALAALGQDR